MGLNQDLNVSSLGKGTLKTTEQKTGMEHTSHVCYSRLSPFVVNFCHNVCQVLILYFPIYSADPSFSLIVMKHSVCSPVAEVWRLLRALDAQFYSPSLHREQSSHTAIAVEECFVWGLCYCIWNFYITLSEEYFCPQEISAQCSACSYGTALCSPGSLNFWKLI